MNALSAVKVTGSSDAGAAAAQRLIGEADAHDGSSPISDQALLAAAQGRRDLLLFSALPSTHESAATGAAPGAASDAGSAVAVGVIGEGELDLVVAPAARGRGHGTSALAALLARREATAGPVRAWSHGENPAADRLLTRAGFAPVRSLYRMSLNAAQLPSDGRDPLATALPAGYQLRTFDPTNDVDAWVAVNAAAFHDHPEQGRMSAQDVRLLMDEPWFDPADLLLLGGPDAPQLAGSTWVKTLRGTDGAAPETELYAVGVHPDHAGHGLGRALLEATLARMAQHAPGRVTLYVDGENERAVELYQRASFVVESRSQQWELV